VTFFFRGVSGIGVAFPGVVFRFPWLLQLTLVFLVSVCPVALLVSFLRSGLPFFSLFPIAGEPRTAWGPVVFFFFIVEAFSFPPLHVDPLAFPGV